MKRTVKALQDLYVKLGGNLTDTYAGIADGIKVGLYERIPDIIEAVKEKASGGGGAGLPEVTTADNGDVLTVVEGEWAKASPSGGGTFDIKFTTEYDQSTGITTASCNKTYAEITTEYQAHGYDNMRVTCNDSEFPTNFIYAPPNTFQAFFCTIMIDNNQMYAYTITVATDPQTQEDVVTCAEKIYSLTPSS